MSLTYEANTSSKINTRLPDKSLSMAGPMEVGVSHDTEIRRHIHILAGLLVAACVNMAPEGTFGAAVAEVGVLDLLKVIGQNQCIYGHSSNYHIVLSLPILPLVCFFLGLLIFLQCSQFP
jgi:hypothetical protein